ncbi:hypothetical protein GCK32_002403, partial [Trichostrongylus colubriformis]
DGEPKETIEHLGKSLDDVDRSSMNVGAGGMFFASLRLVQEAKGLQLTHIRCYPWPAFY